MSQQIDTVPAVETSSTQAVEGHAGGVHLTPAMVLRWLPKTATPAQQDSIIQAHFQPEEIRWSTRPDTLHLPGHDKGHNMLDVKLPQYYREGFFSKNTLFHPELQGGRYGVAGTPVPYSVHNDYVITSLLFCCFVLTVVAFSRVRGFISRQAKKFFRLPNEGSSGINETANELRFELFLVGLTGLMLALLYYFYTLNYIAETFVLYSQYQLIVIYLSIIAAYFLLKSLAYTVVNKLFFDGKKNGQWMKEMLFLTAIEGCALFPAVLLYSYFEWDIRKVIIYFAFILLIVKLLTIYKSYVIFFRRKVFVLQIILYFCALESVPLFLLWNILDITTNSLKINF